MIWTAQLHPHSAIAVAWSQSNSCTDCDRCTHIQDPFLEGRDLTTYIGTMSTKPGSAGPSNSFSKWQKGGVSDCLWLSLIHDLRYGGPDHLDECSWQKLDNCFKGDIQHGVQAQLAQEYRGGSSPSQRMATIMPLTSLLVFIGAMLH